MIVSNYVTLNLFQGPISKRAGMLRHLPGGRQELNMTVNIIIV